MKGRWKLSIVALAVTAGSVATAGALATTSVKNYVVPVGEEYEVDALFSVNDQVPLIGDASKKYRMVGIPDGLGAHPNGNGTSTLFMNHELTSSTQSQPVVGGAMNRGAFVSKWILDANGNPIAGKRAYDSVFQENTFVGPAAEVGNSTRPFSRFCSGSLAGPEEGFDRYIYMTNEEEGTPANSFDGKGGQTVAIVPDLNAIYALPKLGRFAWEQSLVQPGGVNRPTVIMSMEDGPAALDKTVENSQVYMYVGTKDRRPGQTVLGRNGLDNGELYVLAPVDPTKASEAEFASGTIQIKWMLIPNAQDLDEAQLEAASDAVNAFRFARPEDTAFNDRNRNELFFVTTGGATGVNELGRLYSLDLHPSRPTKNATLRVEYAADAVIKAGGDIAISPDNIDVSKNYLMINEDGTAESRLVMAAKNRDGSIWRFDLRNNHGIDVSSAKRVAELNPPGWDGVAVGPGIWETSGIIDTASIFGQGSWLSDVQAHPPTTAPGGSTVTVEDGQLFLMRRA